MTGIHFIENAGTSKMAVLICRVSRIVPAHVVNIKVRGHIHVCKGKNIMLLKQYLFHI